MQAHLLTDQCGAAACTQALHELCLYDALRAIHLYTHKASGISVSPSSSIPENLSDCITPLKRIKAATARAHTCTHRPMLLHNYTCAGTSNPPPSSCTMSSAPCRHQRGGVTQPATTFLRQPHLRW